MLKYNCVGCVDLIGYNHNNDILNTILVRSIYYRIINFIINRELREWRTRTKQYLIEEIIVEMKIILYLTNSLW